MDFFLIAVAILCGVVSGSNGILPGPGCLLGGGINPALINMTQKEAFDVQSDLACSVNDSTRYSFLEQIKSELSLTERGYFDSVATFHDSWTKCRSSSECPNSIITWCINLYHPTERVQMCMNKEGIINATDYARHLQLECYFSVGDCGPRSSFKNCIKISQPEYFLDYSLLTCTSHNCSATGESKTSYTTVFVEVVGRETEKPVISILPSTELHLGSTNIYLCTVHFVENRPFTSQSANWFINGSSMTRINENPFCSNQQNCKRNDSLATTRNDRVRVYEERFVKPGCPFNTFYYKEWLWIDNATESDADLNYSCSGTYTFYNPFRRIVTGERPVSLTRVYPIMNVSVLEVPVVDDYFLDIDVQSFQWTCAVAAGVGDSLVWLHNEEVIPSNVTDVANYSQDIKCEEPGQIFAVHLPVEDLGGFSRGYNVTLVGCDFPLSLSEDLFECVVNQTTGSLVGVWSVSVEAKAEMVVGEKFNLISLVIVGPVCGILLCSSLSILVALCYMKYYQRKKRIVVLDPLFGAATVTLTEEMRRTINKEKEVEKELFTYDPLEFPREKLILSEQLLGEGAFGRVVQAKAEGIVVESPDRNIVAVKTCRENAPHHEINDLWEELQLMKQMKPHENILNLLSYCTTPDGPLYLIVEYAVHGSLKNYLHQCKEAVLKLNHTPHVVSLHRHGHPSNGSSCFTGSSAYPSLQEKIPLSQQNSVFSVSSHSSKLEYSPPSLIQSGSKVRHLTQDSGFFGGPTTYPTQDYINCKGLLYMEDVQNFAIQIAQGLSHLEKLEIVHCDLAARNILIAEGFVLKIGDYGMARDVSNKQYYKTHREGRIPVKWTAPEALQHHIFTHQTDIWSYGVLLWEIFTYGQKPYPNQKIHHSLDSFIKYLMEGNRLPLPDGCPSHFYDIMLSCWNLSPDQRPCADELITLLSKEFEVDSLVAEPHDSRPPSRSSISSPELKTPV